MPLKDFLNQSNNTQTETAPPTGSLSSFLGLNDTGNEGVRTSTPTTTPDRPKNENESTLGDNFRWLGKQLMKPVGVTAKETRGIGSAIGNLLSIASPRVSASEGVKRAAKNMIDAHVGAGRVLMGNEETDFIKEMENAGIEPDRLQKTMGVGANFVLDPLWLVAPVKAIKTIGKVTKLEKPAIALAKTLKNTPPVKRMKMLFSNTTGNKEFDLIVKKFRNLRGAREGSLIDDAVQLQKDIKKMGKGAEGIITEGLENPDSLIKITDKKILNITESLRNVYKDLLKKSKEVGLSVGEIEHYAPHIRTKESFVKKFQQHFGLGVKEFSKGQIEAGRKLKGTIKELGEKGINIFEQNPAIQLVKKGQAFAKAITSQEFAHAVKTFAVKNGEKVSHPTLKGLKFEPEVAKVIDNFYKGIKPDELKVAIRSFDKVQNLWKAQALISPSYHIRNVAGNLWNNFLANVNPIYYKKAAHIQKGTLVDDKIMKEMKELGVIDQGWYAKDIGEEVLNRVESIGSWKKLNPLNQENALFQLNRKAGSAVENNARIAHYLSKKAEGLTPMEAAESVKKYLFDYGDLTSFEKNVMKRVAPFYTWTRKNLPLQMEGVVTQPAKYVLPHKLVELIESGVEVPKEKYMGHYIRENVPVRVRKNEDGDTEYFLLGNWLPYANAIDILSSPMENFVNMLTPMVKTPYEYLSNQSTFFKDTLGKPSKIERTYKAQGEFLGQSMRKKNILLLRNIRILSDVNKWIDKQDPRVTNDSTMVKILNTLFGKTATYDVQKSKYFYDIDREEHMNALEQAIRSSSRRKFKDKAKKLKQELKEFRQNEF